MGSATLRCRAGGGAFILLASGGLPRRAGWRLWVLNNSAQLPLFSSPVGALIRVAACRCRDCGGSSFCMHGRQQHTCRDCGGVSMCQHRRQQVHCRDCGNFVCQIQDCPRQDHPFSGAQSLLKHMRTMHGDNPRAMTKSKELEVHQALRDAQITFEYQHYLPFRGCGLESETAHAFADFALPAGLRAAGG